jgi:vacuolar-type H+-ATPase subunit E/Vma4
VIFVEGSPEKLSSKVVEKVLKEYIEYLNGVKKDALGMLEDGYKKLRTEASSKLNELYSSYEDSTKSIESSLELQMKLNIQKKRNEMVEEALAEAERRIFALGEKDKEKLYTPILKKALDSALGRNFEVHVEPREKKLFDRMVKKLTEEEVEIKPDLPEGTGGFILIFPDTNVSQDFTLKKMFELMKDELMVVAKRTLFGEE